MEVLVVAATSGTDALFDAVLSVLQSGGQSPKRSAWVIGWTNLHVLCVASSTPIEVLTDFPVPSIELQDHQLVHGQSRYDAETIMIDKPFVMAIRLSRGSAWIETLFRS